MYIIQMQTADEKEWFNCTTCLPQSSLEAAKRQAKHRLRKNAAKLGLRKCKVRIVEQSIVWECSPLDLSTIQEH